MYAPFGAGVLIGPRRVFAARDPFLVGGGAASVPDLDDVAWAAPPEREEVGSPNAAVRVSAGINISEHDVARLLSGIERLVAGKPPVRYRRDPSTGDFYPVRSGARVGQSLTRGMRGAQ